MAAHRSKMPGVLGSILFEFIYFFFFFTVKIWYILDFINNMCSPKKLKKTKTMFRNKVETML